MSRFRLFGRSAPPPPYPSPAPGAAPGGWGAPADVWGQPGPPPAAAGRGAPPPPPVRPVVPAPSAWAPPVDPPTDPRGFAPVPAVVPGAVVPGAVVPGVGVDPELPDPAEAAALAGAFAADYLSWDEDDPDRRGQVLADYLPDPGSDPARLGWSGTGRQRADFALPGRVRPDGEGRVLVDVRVRVTPYRPVGEHGPDAATADDPDVAGVPAVAPAPTSRGWRGLPAHWVRISVPISTEGGRLVVDAWEETLGEDPPPSRPPAPVDDHSLADDEPPAPVDAGSGW